MGPSCACWFHSGFTGSAKNRVQVWCRYSRFQHSGRRECVLQYCGSYEKREAVAKIKVTVKGLCAGFLMDVSLVDAVQVE